MEKYRGKDNIDIMMEEFIEEDGKKIWWTVKEFINGKMEESMLVGMKMIKKMDMEGIIGLINEYSRVTG